MFDENDFSDGDEFGHEIDDLENAPTDYDIDFEDDDDFDDDDPLGDFDDHQEEDISEFDDDGDLIIY